MTTAELIERLRAVDPAGQLPVGLWAIAGLAPDVIVERVETAEGPYIMIGLEADCA